MSDDNVVPGNFPTPEETPPEPAPDSEPTPVDPAPEAPGSATIPPEAFLLGADHYLRTAHGMIDTIAGFIKDSDEPVLAMEQPRVKALQMQAEVCMATADIYARLYGFMGAERELNLKARELEIRERELGLEQAKFFISQGAQQVQTQPEPEPEPS